MKWEHFENHVQFVLQTSPMGDVFKIIYGQTPLKQKFAIVITTVIWWAVRIIPEEDHLNLPRLQTINCYSDLIMKKKQFFGISEAFDFAKKTERDLKNGKFENLVRCRIRALPNNNPELYLMRGDIVRRVFKKNPFGGSNLYHEGVYLGNSKVAHIHNPDEGAPKAEYKANACARITTLKTFLKGERGQIMVPCFRRRHRNEICEDAYKYVKNSYGKGTYNLLNRNCHHFASLCAFGKGVSSDVFRIENDFKIINRAGAGYVSFLATFLVGPIAVIPQIYFLGSALKRGWQQSIQSKEFKLDKTKAKSAIV